MKLVPQNINEAIKHLQPRDKEEIDTKFDQEVKDWVSSGLSGSVYLTENIVAYLVERGDILPTSQHDSESIYNVADEIIIYLFYEYVKDENKLVEAIKNILKNNS